MKAKFSRRVPYYLLPIEDATDSDGFDAYPVDVDTRTLEIAVALRNITDAMTDKFDNMPAPEEAAQEEAALFEDLITEVVYEYKSDD